MIENLDDLIGFVVMCVWTAVALGLFLRSFFRAGYHRHAHETEIEYYKEW